MPNLLVLSFEVVELVNFYCCKFWLLLMLNIFEYKFYLYVQFNGGLGVKDPFPALGSGMVLAVLGES